MNRRRLLAAGTALGSGSLLTGFPALSFSQGTWPSQPVKIVIGFAPGSGTDVAARMMAQELQSTFHQTFIVENRPGAAVQIAATLVKAAAPDGYTLLMTSNSSHSVNPHVFKKLAYDPIADFTPIGSIAAQQFIVAVNGELPVRTLPELMSWARANRGKVFYGYSGTVFRVPGETLNLIGDLGATGVPFKSSPDAMTELIAGRLQFMVVDVASSRPHVQSGRMRALAVTSAKRSQLLPELPTVEEALGVKDFDMAAWIGLFGPAHLPRPIVDRLSDALLEILNRPDVRQRMLAANTEPAPSGATAFAEQVRQNLQLWGVKVREAGIEPE